VKVFGNLQPKMLALMANSSVELQSLHTGDEIGVQGTSNLKAEFLFHFHSGCHSSCLAHASTASKVRDLNGLNPHCSLLCYLKLMFNVDETLRRMERTVSVVSMITPVSVGYVAATVDKRMREDM
jgi:hypothetical protein